MPEVFDAIVVGMGVGGETVAGDLTRAGLRVLGIENRLVGGECPYWGCIPSKMMIRGSDLLAEGRRIPGVAGTSVVTPDWAPVAERIRKDATDNWDDRVAVERFEKSGGTFVRGSGRLAGPGRVEVNGTTYEAKRAVVLSTGTSAVIPPIPGLKDVAYWTNREAIEVEQLPASLAVLGGGAIGLELAQVFARFGVAVTVIEGMDHLLALEEPEAGAILAQVLARDSIELCLSARAMAVRKEGSMIAVTLEGGRQVNAERLLVATGRRANLVGLGLETVGLDPAARSVEVDSHLRAGEKLWAVGDLTGKGAFTHVAVYQARIATRDILGKGGPDADYSALPRVTFTDPEVGAAGITEAAARKQGLRVKTGLQKTSVTARGWIHGPGNEGFIKVVLDADRGTIVGATCMGPRGGDILGIFELAIKTRIPADELNHLIYAYPTFYRGVGEAIAAALGEDEHLR
ncbi:MAG TPA: NAD(P)/FAD-dependent oxidoreductase [Candidatus Dormibacteraeota bacterium]|nr:NAD(P)/FAD-dependent oxidoreductase [Candidatus Dormibacteraeota bacterium]